MNKNIITFTYILLPILLVWLIYLGNPGRYTSLWALSAMISGVLAYVWFNFQFILSARPKWLEKGVGMDYLYRLHGMMALVALGLAFFHGQLKEMVFRDSLMTNLGSIALYIFTGVSLLSLAFMVRSRLHKVRAIDRFRDHLHKKHKGFYELLKAFHKLTIIGQVLILVHVLMTGQVRTSYMTFSVYLGVFVVSFGHYFWYKVVRAWLLTEESLVIKSIEPIIMKGQEAPYMWNLNLGTRGKRPYQPGQFGFFRFLVGNRIEEHPFTIASSPGDEDLQVSIKNLGDFTESLSRLRVGDEVLMDGPYGHFSYLNHYGEGHVVFMVAGIGITPALSMIRHKIRAMDPIKMTLNIQVRSLEEMVFLDELIQYLEKDEKLFVNIYVSRDHVSTKVAGDRLKILSGRIGDNLEELTLETSERKGYYLCGPPGFMEGLQKALSGNGVGHPAIHLESFSL